VGVRQNACFEAENGQSALELMAAHPPDLVRKRRASGNTDHLPIIMVTGQRTVRNVKEALDEAGADGYITRPYTISEWRRPLATVIERAAKHCGE
jgi:DNA-binding response OmpR family regulator